MMVTDKKRERIKMTITKEMTFEFKAELKVGHMRVDYKDGSPYSQWFTRANFQAVIPDQTKKIKEFSSYITRTLIPDFDTMIDDYCDGFESYGGDDSHYNYFKELDDLNVWIRMIPVMGDYNMYINFYIKDENK